MVSEEKECIILCTADELQLPIYTAHSLRELSRMLGMSYSAVHNAYKNQTPLRLPKEGYNERYGYVIKVPLSCEPK